MSNYEKHAMMEFRAAGWIDDKENYCDEMQEAMCKHVIKLLEVFGEEGHSGSSAPYAVELFRKLAIFEPIVPLTGEDWEWNKIQDNPILYQNRRCSHVFKDDNRAYDIEKYIFYEWFTDEETGERFRSYYTNKGSREEISFPYTPEREYIFVEEESDERTRGKVFARR